MSLFKKGKQIELSVQGMTCGHCEQRVKNALEKIEGADSAVASHKKNNAIVILKKGKDVSIENLITTVIESGYQAELGN